MRKGSKSAGIKRTGTMVRRKPNLI
jgi:hypothetical protein